MTQPTTRPAAGLTLRPLDHDDPADVEQVAALIDADPGYVERVEGRTPRPGDAERLLRDAPPDLPQEGKVVLGAFDDGVLVAVVDLLRGWPEPGTAHIGLLQVHAAHQGHGLGRKVHDEALGWVAGHWPEVVGLRAAIVAPNAARAVPFWRALSYRPHGEPVLYTGDHIATTAQIWVRPLL